MALLRLLKKWKWTVALKFFCLALQIPKKKYTAYEVIIIFKKNFWQYLKEKVFEVFFFAMEE